jgi:hypothetical protein
MKYSLTSCGYQSRTVRLDVDRWIRGSNQSQNDIHVAMLNAVRFAWQNCPLTAHISGDPNMVDSASLFLSDGTEVLRVAGLKLQPGGYDWTTTPVLPSLPGSLYAAGRGSPNTIWPGLKWIFWVVVAIVVLSFLNTYGLIARFLRWLGGLPFSIVRSYYFTFHPHPAAPLVRGALATGNLLDGKALAQVLSEIPAGSRMFREARLAQAETLFHEMQTASEALLRRQRAEAHAKARHDYEEAALNSIQEAVALAAVALERAKALYRASRQVGKRTTT